MWAVRQGEFRPAAVVALAMAVATLLVAWGWDLPVRDPDGVSVPTWLRLPAIVGVAVLLDVVVRWALLARAGHSPREALAEVRERWGRDQVVFTLSGLATWYVAYVAFRNLKSYVPFVNPRLWDDELARLDKVLGLGHDPATLLHQVLGTGWAAWFMAAVYLVWIALLPATLAIALVWTRRSTAGAWFVTAISLDWLLGALTYYAMPTLGPVYADPGTFAGLPRTPNTDVQEMLQDDRAAVLADVWGTSAVQTIAAFASLHVAVMVTICLHAEMIRLPRALRVAGWTFLALTALSTVYLGWHYALDVVGGAAVGTLALWLAARMVGVPWRRRDYGWSPTAARRRAAYDAISPSS